MILTSLKLKMNLSYPPPKPIYNPNHDPDSDTESKPDSDRLCSEQNAEYIDVFLMVCWITFLVWGFIHLLTREQTDERDDDARMAGSGHRGHGRLRM